jgi:hypothetical protein
MFETPTLEEAHKAWELYNNSPSLRVADGLWVYGSGPALDRVQMYILASASEHRRDVNAYLANELKLAEKRVIALREQLLIHKTLMQAGLP